MTDFRAILLAVLPLLVSAAIMIAGNGLFGTLLSVRLDREGIAVEAIGAILACYSLGWIAGTLACPSVINRVGHIRSFAAFAALVAVSALIHPLFVDGALWGVLWAMLRMLTGFCIAALYTIIESWLNAKSANAVRGRVMSAYMAINFLAYGFGQFLLTVASPAGPQLFSLVAILVCLALVPLTLARVETPPQLEPRRFSLSRLVAVSPLGVAGCLTAGLITGAFSALGPVYARTIRPDPNWVAEFMMVAVFSGLILQFPMGRLSDRFDRRRVILGLTLASGAVSAALVWLGTGSTGWLLGLIALHSGIAYTLYPISLAHANDYITPEELIPTAGGLLLCFGAGAAVGPVAAAAAMARLGSEGLFVYFTAVAMLLAGFAVYRMFQRVSLPNELQGTFVPVPQTTPTATLLDPRSVPEDPQLAFDFAPVTKP